MFIQCLSVILEQKTNECKRYDRDVILYSDGCVMAGKVSAFCLKRIPVPSPLKIFDMEVFVILWATN
jgi:hypothetical protein